MCYIIQTGGKAVYGPTSAQAKQWAAARSERLDEGDVEAIVTCMKRLRPRQSNVREEVRKAIDYFQTTKQRMRYAKFRSQGLFVGSGVVEAGCKTVIGLRLKQSGMRWTVDHANAIIALRCCQLSGRWEEFWEQRSVGSLEASPFFSQLVFSGFGRSGATPCAAPALRAPLPQSPRRHSRIC